jgi:hypothetical protein
VRVILTAAYILPESTWESQWRRKHEALTLTASKSFSKASRSFFIISISALAQASTVPFTVMVLSGLYMLKSCKLANGKKQRNFLFSTGKINFHIRNKSWEKQK